ncbi:aminodeoxychorismate synthase component I [Elusimicrobiota bacterium]
MIIKKVNLKTGFDKVFNFVKDCRYPFFLDSGKHHDKLGKFSFIGFDPLAVFKAKDDKIEIVEGNSRHEFTNSKSLDIFQNFFDKYAKNHKSPFPFSGGFVGFLSYDLCRKIEKIPSIAEDDKNIPDICFGLYDGIFVYDHNRRECLIIAHGINKPAENIIKDLTAVIKRANKKIKYVKPPQEKIKNKINSNFSKQEYIKSIGRVKRYIKNGDIYQVNLTQRFETKYTKDPWLLYQRLRNINPAPFSSFIDYGDFQIISSSPERFFCVDNRKIQTRPIKGTIARGQNNQQDILNKKILLNSEKDKSELIMIVDVARNDLGRISKIGTVKVEKLFSLEKYPTVYHLVSTVTGELREDVKFADIIKATFPGASITGAPKIRAMEIIDELEPTRRNIYTGSIGYLDFNGNMDFNIVIRTIILKGGKAFFQAGGGIVWDSDKESEYKESILKAKALQKAVEG